MFYAIETGLFAVYQAPTAFFLAVKSGDKKKAAK
jgi:hypothetical protein